MTTSTTTSAKATPAEAKTQFPETLEELRAFDPLFALMPDMTPPSQFTPAQTVDWAMLSEAVSQHQKRLEQGGYLTGSKTVKPFKPYELAATLGAVVEVCDKFFAPLAKDANAYREWTSGLDLASAFQLFFILSSFYERLLGKSVMSKLKKPDTLHS